MPPTIVIPTQQQLYDSQHNPNSLLAMYQKATTPAPIAGSPGAVTSAGGSGAMGGPSQLNALNNPEWITAMSDMINQINTKAQQESNAARIPGAANIEKASSANIQSALGGNVPDDVFREMQQRAAERGVFTGSPAGANTTADLMRSLGLTSLDMTNLGQKWTNEALARNPGAPIFNPAQLVTSAGDAEKLNIARENMQLDYLAKMAAINASRDRYRGGSGYGPGGGSGGARFAPATNWQGSPTATATPTPFSAPWHDPGNGQHWGGDISDEEWNNMLYGYPTDPNPQGTDWTSQTPEPYVDYYNPGGSINTGGMSQDELDWLYNVGG